MTITTKNENGTYTILPEGWLDTNSSPELGAVVDAVDSADTLVLDFDKVEYMSSAGLRQVVAAGKRAQAIGAAFAVVNVCPDVMSIFKITGLQKKLDIRAR